MISLWQTLIDSEGKMYYYNPLSQETSRQKPMDGKPMQLQLQPTPKPPRAFSKVTRPNQSQSHRLSLSPTAWVGVKRLGPKFYICIQRTTSRKGLSKAKQRKCIYLHPDEWQRLRHVDSDIQDLLRTMASYQSLKE